jgi:aminoglycoside/choline kinase family phosphotransferase
MLSGIAICYLRTNFRGSPAAHEGRDRIDETNIADDRRLDELGRWLAQFDDLAGSSVSPASADASFRRYFRVQTNGTTRIVMDAPPGREDCGPFVRIAGYLEQMQLNSPRVLHADHEHGFLLLTDLGSRQYLDELKQKPERSEELYGEALAALLTMQEHGRRFQGKLPPYDAKLLRFELSLFRDWLCVQYLGLDFTEEEHAWRACAELLVDNALRQPKVFVHRDFHSRNLMVTAKDNPGILDFQDAVEGPVTYDLVSLLKDCYIRWPAERVLGWAGDFHAAGPAKGYGVRNAADFIRSFELMGVQRHLKAAGIFARLWLRDGKSSYLHDVPRTLEYIVELAPRYPELAPLVRLIADRCLPALRGKVPAPATAEP